MRRTSAMVSWVSAALMPAVGSSRHKQLRLGRKRDADLEIALLAVRQVGGELVGLGGKADRGKHGFGLVDDVAEVRCSAVSMLQACRRDCAAMRTFSSTVALGRMLVIW